jgi:hypothetical protein
LAKGDVIVSVKYREVFFTAIFLGDEMLGRGHWENTDFHPFLHGKAVKNDQSFDCNNKLVINKNKHELRLFHRFPTGFSEVPYRG